MILLIMIINLQVIIVCILFYSDLGFRTRALGLSRQGTAPWELRVMALSDNADLLFGV